ncbi:NYN domain-containing protein [Pyrococcus kukulkanii]|uniref:NYN domain-containing protein n=1 Tax=Pyrococcus kukulkanii TaxID=1609559 RepID=UPI0035675E69
MLVDLENVVLGLRDLYGEDARLDRDVNWKALFMYLEGLGYEVVIARGFASPFYLGKPDQINNLERAGIHVEPTPSFKAGDRVKTLTDSEMIVEGMSVLYERPFIEVLIIISGDKDFVPLADKARELGKEILFAGFMHTMARVITERYGVIDLAQFTSERLEVGGVKNEVIASL